MCNHYFYHFRVQVVAFLLIYFVVGLNLLAGASTCPVQDENLAPVKQDSVIVKPDSLLKNLPVEIKINPANDSTFEKTDETLFSTKRSEINHIFYNDPADIFVYFPGVTIFDRGSSGQELNCSRQGNSAVQTTILFDGRPFYNPIYGITDLNYLPIGFISKMSIKNEMSPDNLLHNGESLVFQSEKYRDEVPYSQIYHHKAGFGYSDVDFVFGQPVSQRINVLLGGSLRSFDGRNMAYNYEQQNLRGKLEYFISRDWRLNYSLISNKLNREEPGPVNENGTYQTQTTYVKNDRADHTLNIFGRIFKSEQRNFWANLYYSSLFTKTTDDTFSVTRKDKSKYSGIILQWSQRILGQTLTIGGNFEHVWTEAGITGTNQLNQSGLYFQDEWNFKQKFVMSFLAGHKSDNRQNTNFIGGIQSHYKLSENFNIFAGAKQSVRFPTLFELHAEENYLGNPELKNEIIQKTFTGLDCQLFSRLKLFSQIYQKNIKQGITYQAVDSATATFSNSEDKRFFGADLGITYQLTEKLNWYTVLTSLENNKLINQPDVQITSYIQFQDSFFNEDLNTKIRIETRYIGNRTSVTYHPYLYSFETQELSPTLILNGFASLNFGKLNIFLMYENILNNEYEYIYGFPMNGRTFHYGLRWEFWE